MKTIRATFLAAGCLGVWWFAGDARSQEAPPVVVKPYSRDFILFEGRSHSIYVPIHPPDDPARDKTTVAVDTFTVSLKPLPSDTKELPEVRFELGGTRYVVPARKIIMVPAEPKTQGIFAHAALDPNGTGNFEVLLTINWQDWPDTEKHIEFLSRLLPEGLEVVENSASWSRPNGGLSWTKTLVFHNRSGRPFIFDPGFFENLPTTEGWPDIVVPPAE